MSREYRVLLLQCTPLDAPPVTASAFRLARREAGCARCIQAHRWLASGPWRKAFDSQAEPGHAHPFLPLAMRRLACTCRAKEPNWHDRPQFWIKCESTSGVAALSPG
ncbi:hypothetical protein BKA63DRAFT_490789 [Paraphoma chrysanthemicola]|nr:hypothetical protein BKA63DRAFT_490789 [Paraphoma chrysanthemicola]